IEGLQGKPVGVQRFVFGKAVEAYALFVFFFNDTATTEIYPLSLHDALPISPRRSSRPLRGQRSRASGKRGGRMSGAGAPQDAHRAPLGGSAAALAASVG